jgi:two-component system, NtrC family, sensor histidine kinase HydH
MRSLLSAEIHDGRALIRYFALLSLVLTALIATTLALVVSYYLRKDLLEREWRITADYVRTQAFYHLAPSDFAAPWSSTVQERFRAFFEHTVMMPDVVRIKIYDATMAVVWSDEPRLIGQRYPDNLQLTSAMAGQTMVNLELSEMKPENIYEQDKYLQLVEVYVPIEFPGTSRVAGVVEIYKVPTKVFANIRQAQFTVIGTAVIGGVLLYPFLYWIVRRVAGRIDEQHKSLENRSRELASANQKLHAVQAQLLKAERLAAIGEVVTAVAHGIRNPLANIRASAQVAAFECRESGVSGLTPKNLINIMAEVDRLDALLKELLHFVAPAERQSKPVDLNAVVRGAVQMTAGRIATARFKVDERFAPNLPPIMGDPILIEQVFLSLIGNAIEANPDNNGTVTISTGMNQGNGAAKEVFVEVSDTGCGITREEISKIFEPFYTTKAQGTGLGLSIARKFTEAYGGSISVSSCPGEGATFRVTFPC